jgi:3-oxoisoapionate kinase
MPLLYSYYGDDFTGSTDVLEQLAANGVASVLFVSEPTPAQMARFADRQAVGFAGDARSRSPEWMSAHLPAIFHRMKQLGPAVAHYKVCSTFDSAPHQGSIGRAIELGREVFATPAVPIGVAAPHLGRYLLFGNLFAAAGKDVYRIDRHPTMADHPATPMHEADLRRHLALQTNLPIGLVDLRAFQNHSAAEQFRQQQESGAATILLDGLDTPMLEQAGRLIWELRQPAQPVFTVGSSGVTASLMAHWRTSGLISSWTPSVTAPASEQVLVLSGSCSPVTAGQIEWARRQGYACFPLDAGALAGGEMQAIQGEFRRASPLLKAGKDAVLYTALGAPSGATHDAQLGRAIGQLLRALVEETGVRRVVLCGGDTASHAVQQLNLIALTFAGVLAPGAPLCRAHAEPGTTLDGLEVVLKGGQIGPENFFQIVRGGSGL